MPDPREPHLAALIVELAKIEAGQAEAKKVMKEVREDLEEQIQRLAAEIESGQAELFEGEPGDKTEACSVCGAACTTTVSISTPGGKPTPPSCLKCMKKATDAVRSGRR